MTSPDPQKEDRAKKEKEGNTGEAREAHEYCCTIGAWLSDDPDQSAVTQTFCCAPCGWWRIGYHERTRRDVSNSSGKCHMLRRGQACELITPCNCLIGYPIGLLCCYLPACCVMWYGVRTGSPPNCLIGPPSSSCDVPCHGVQTGFYQGHC